MTGMDTVSDESCAQCASLAATLRIVEAHCRGLYDCVPEALFVHDLEGRIHDANQVAVGRWGYELPRLRQMRLAELEAPTDGPHWSERLRTLRQRRTLSYETVHLAADGTTIPSAVHCALVTEGEYEAVVALARVLGPGTMPQSRFQAAIDAAAEAVVIVAEEQRVSYVNEAFERLTGLAGGQVVGRHMASIGLSGLPEQVFALADGGGVWRGRVTGLRPNGDCFTAKATISPVRGPEGRVGEHVALLQDISSELELQRQLSRAHTLTVVGQLAGGIAHDFKNILAGVRGLATAAGNAIDEADPRHECIDEIVHAVDRATALVRQLVTFSRHESGRLARLDLNALIGEAERLLRPGFGAAIRVQLHLQPGLPPVEVDPVEMEQVLLNLAINARDAMPRGGCLRIQTELISGSELARHLPEAWPGPAVALTVTDTGSGMSPETLARAFEPYYTTKIGSESSGLGLSTVHNIILSMKGRIKVASQPGIGTTFVVYLRPAEEAERP